jgi:hypothetical protein
VDTGTPPQSGSIRRRRQHIYASCDKAASRFDYESGAIEQPEIEDRVVQILEGTEPAFKNRQSKYRLG